MCSANEGPAAACHIQVAKKKSKEFLISKGVPEEIAAPASQSAELVRTGFASELLGQCRLLWLVLLRVVDISWPSLSMSGAKSSGVRVIKLPHDIAHPLTVTCTGRSLRMEAPCSRPQAQPPPAPQPHPATARRPPPLPPLLVTRPPQRRPLQLATVRHRQAPVY